jgi:hypothetical protein
MRMGSLPCMSETSVIISQAAAKRPSATTCSGAFSSAWRTKG